MSQTFYARNILLSIVFGMTPLSSFLGWIHPLCCHVVLKKGVFFSGNCSRLCNPYQPVLTDFCGN